MTGGLDDGSENAPFADELGPHFTVYNYNRRGRGHSGDTEPYALEREIEDIGALVAEAGGTANLYGVSSGGACRPRQRVSRSTGSRSTKFPYMMGADASQRWQEYVGAAPGGRCEGRRGAAVELFMRLAGASEQNIVQARNSSIWPRLEAISHTLAYDAACLGDGHLPTDRFAQIGQPTLVVTGGRDDLFESAADAIAASLPQADVSALGQGHVVDPKALAPLLAPFLKS